MKTILAARIGSIAAIVLLGCAQVLAAEDCACQSLHDNAAIPQDLGRGLVGQEVISTGFQAPDVTWVLVRTVLQDCASGRQARLVGQHGSTDGTIDVNKTREISALMQDLRAGQAEMPFETALSDATEAGISFDGAVSQDETCGCHVHYPGLRGSKKPYEVT